MVIYAGMHRDATLSYITGTHPGELGLEFWRQLITFRVGPLLGLLTTLFPRLRTSLPPGCSRQRARSSNIPGHEGAWRQARGPHIAAPCKNPRQRQETLPKRGEPPAFLRPSLPIRSNMRFAATGHLWATGVSSADHFQGTIEDFSSVAEHPFAFSVDSARVRRVEQEVGNTNGAECCVAPNLPRVAPSPLVTPAPVFRASVSDSSLRGPFCHLA
jgi:hypothetical protein